MKKNIIVSCAGAALLLVGSASAESKYGTAGCGLGSLIFEPSGGITQIFAATTNGSSGNQTFGITSGTSNCEAGPEGSASATKNFATTNRAALAKDIARGQGETLSSLAQLAGCQDAALVGRTLQSKFSLIFPTAQTSDAQVGDSVVRVLQSEKTLACSTLAG